MIACTDLTRTFGGTGGVRDLTLDVLDGQLHAIVGPNGSGKSTLLRLIAGLLMPSEGSVTIAGIDVHMKNSAALAGVGALVDFPAFYPELTAYENLRYVAMLRSFKQSQIVDALEHVRLKHAQNRRVRDFSMGMKQRLGLALALMGRPRLLILDEPTSSLDPVVTETIEELVRQYHRVHGATVLFTSHSLDQVERLATHVSLLIEGSLLASHRADEQSTVGVHVEFERTADVDPALVAEACGIAHEQLELGEHSITVRSLELSTYDAREVQRRCLESGLTFRTWKPVSSRWRHSLMSMLRGNFTVSQR